jgi:hypothetical protein
MRMPVGGGPPSHLVGLPIQAVDDPPEDWNSAQVDAITAFLSAAIESGRVRDGPETFEKALRGPD